MKPPSNRCLAALEHPDSEWTGLEVFGSIMQIGPPAVKPLVAALRHPSEKVRREVVQFLTHLGDENAVEPLIKALGDPDGDVARAAAYGLAELDDPRAVAPLAAAIKDRSSALWRAGNPYLPDSRPIASRDWQPACRRTWHRWSPRWKTARWHLRYAAAWVLGRLGDKRATESLATVLKSAERSASMRSRLAACGCAARPWPACRARSPLRRW